MDKAEKSKMFLQECIEKIVKSWQDRRGTIERPWQKPFIFIEWICEWLSDTLERWAFLEVLKHLGRLTIIIAVVLYFTESGSRRKAKHYQAWQVINLAQGKTGSGGRKKALEDLRKDNVSLVGVDVSKAHLPELKLENTKLWRANFAEAYLGGAIRGANLSRAKLVDANFTKANLEHANLTEAKLVDANFAEAFLLDVNLTRANLWNANLAGAELFIANLTGANLEHANLTGAILYQANLTGANLAEADLTGAILAKADLKNINNWQKIETIKNANIYGVKNTPDGFIKWAEDKGTVSNEIEDKVSDKWKRLINKKMEEKKKQEAENNKGDQKKVR